jgi:hypothetical protein
MLACGWTSAYLLGEVLNFAIHRGFLIVGFRGNEESNLSLCSSIGSLILMFLLLTIWIALAPLELASMKHFCICLESLDNRLLLGSHWIVGRNGGSLMNVL